MCPAISRQWYADAEQLVTMMIIMLTIVSEMANPNPTRAKNAATATAWSPLPESDKSVTGNTGRQARKMMARLATPERREVRKEPETWWRGY